MIAASSFLPSRFRGQQAATRNSAPSWFSNRITPLLQTLASLTSLHPIHTIVIVAVLASSTYLGLLEESLFDVLLVAEADGAEYSSKSFKIKECVL